MHGPGNDPPDLIEGLMQGDQQALASLLAQHQDRLRRMIEHRLDARLKGRLSPSDLLQDVFIDAYKLLRHYQAHADLPFYVWLRSVTIRRLMLAHRHHLGTQARDAAREVPLDRDPSACAILGRMVERTGATTSPRRFAVRAEATEVVRDALGRLDPHDREVLALRHFVDLDNREVAATLGITTAAASKRYVRARDRLKGILERNPDFG